MYRITTFALIALTGMFWQPLFPGGESSSMLIKKTVPTFKSPLAWDYFFTSTTEQRLRTTQKRAATAYDNWQTKKNARPLLLTMFSWWEKYANQNVEIEIAQPEAGLELPLNTAPIEKTLRVPAQDESESFELMYHRPIGQKHDFLTNLFLTKTPIKTTTKNVQRFFTKLYELSLNKSARAEQTARSVFIPKNERFTLFLQNLMQQKNDAFTVTTDQNDSYATLTWKRHDLILPEYATEIQLAQSDHAYIITFLQPTIPCENTWGNWFKVAIKNVKNAVIPQKESRKDIILTNNDFLVAAINNKLQPQEAPHFTKACSLLDAIKIALIKQNNSQEISNSLRYLKTNLSHITTEQARKYLEINLEAIQCVHQTTGVTVKSEHFAPENIVLTIAQIKDIEQKWRDKRTPITLYLDKKIEKIITSLNQAITQLENASRALEPSNNLTHNHAIASVNKAFDDYTGLGRTSLLRQLIPNQLGPYNEKIKKLHSRLLTLSAHNDPKLLQKLESLSTEITQQSNHLFDSLFRVLKSANISYASQQEIEQKIQPFRKNKDQLEKYLRKKKPTALNTPVPADINTVLNNDINVILQEFENTYITPFQQAIIIGKNQKEVSTLLAQEIQRKVNEMELLFNFKEGVIFRPVIDFEQKIQNLQTTHLL